MIIFIKIITSVVLDTIYNGYPIDTILYTKEYYNSISLSFLSDTGQYSHDDSSINKTECYYLQHTSWRKLIKLNANTGHINVYSKKNTFIYFYEN